MKSNNSKVYLVTDISEMLGISRTTAYDFIKKIYKDKNPCFKVIKIGDTYRIPMSSFDKWLEGE